MTTLYLHARRLPSDFYSPSALYAQARAAHWKSFFCEQPHRWTYIGAEPIAWVEQTEDGVFGRHPEGAPARLGNDPYLAWDGLAAQLELKPISELPLPDPALGWWGWQHLDTASAPAFSYALYRYGWFFDHEQGALYALEWSLNDAHHQLEQKIALSGNAHPLPRFRWTSPLEFPADFAALPAFREGLDWIRRGEFYYLRPQQRLQTAFAGDAWAVFRAMRRHDEPQYSFFADHGAVQCFGMSVETQFLVENGAATTSLQGANIRRSYDYNMDLALLQQLKSDAKAQRHELLLLDARCEALYRFAGAGEALSPSIAAMEFAEKRARVASYLQVPLRASARPSEILRQTFPKPDTIGIPAEAATHKFRAIPERFWGGAVGCLGEKWTLQLTADSWWLAANGNLHTAWGIPLFADTQPDEIQRDAAAETQRIQRILAEASA